MTVSIAGQCFFRTTCWWRAEISDSPPGGNACQYVMFLSGQGCARTAGAATMQSNATTLFMSRVILAIEVRIRSAEGPGDDSEADVAGPATVECICSITYRSV